MTKQDLENFLSARLSLDFLEKIKYEKFILDPFAFKLVKKKVMKQKKERKEFSARGLNDIKVTLKKFFKWLYKTRDYPKVVSWIETSRRVNLTNKLPEELLAPQEIKAMIEKARYTRDKALIITLYESACREGY
jgi:site-specific recombinase XerD